MAQKTVNMLVRLEPPMHLALSQLAEVTGRSKAQLVRDCIAESLNRAKRRARKLRSQRQGELR